MGHLSVPKSDIKESESLHLAHNKCLAPKSRVAGDWLSHYEVGTLRCPQTFVGFRIKIGIMPKGGSKSCLVRLCNGMEHNKLDLEGNLISLIVKWKIKVWCPDGRSLSFELVLNHLVSKKKVINLLQLALYQKIWNVAQPEDLTVCADTLKYSKNVCVTFVLFLSVVTIILIPI